MKKLFLLLTVALFLAGLTACGGGGKYAAIEDTMNKLIDTANEFASAAENAGDVDEAIAAYKNFMGRLEELSPKLGSIMFKYPDLKENPPEELKDLMARVKAANDTLNDAMALLKENYGDDPKYREAKRRITKSVIGW